MGRERERDGEGERTGRGGEEREGTERGGEETAPLHAPPP